MKSEFLKTEILKVKISLASKREVLAWIEKNIQKRGKKMVVTPNPEQVVLAQKDLFFRKILNEAPLALADGVGLLLASKILATRLGLKQRVTGEEVMRELIEKASEKNWKIFLLGGERSVAKKTALRFKRINQGLQIRAWSGARDITKETRQERKRAIKEINDFEPDMLFVAFGAPWQEKWLYKNLPALKIKIGMVVGGAFDMITDPTLKPPKFMSQLGLDWFYRLLRQPWRVRRQLALLKFTWLVIKTRLLEEN